GDVAGRDRVDVDPVGRPLVGERAGQPGDRVLARRVRGHQEPALEAQHRRDVDDLPGAAGDHPAPRRPAQLEGGVQVELDDLVAVRVAERGGRGSADDPGVVDEDVDRVRVEQLLDGLPPGGPVGEVQLRGGDRSAQL